MIGSYWGAQPNAWWGGGPVSDPPPWGGGWAGSPYLGPQPVPWRWGGWGGWGGNGPVSDPAPIDFPTMPSVLRRTPRAFRWPWQVDPPPDEFGIFRPWAGGRVPIPIPVPEPSDPSPIDLGFQVRSFAESIEGILRSGGLNDEQIGRATVADLISAYRAGITPPVAKNAASALTAAQVANLDLGGLERLALHLGAESERMSSLRKTVETRLKELKK